MDLFSFEFNGCCSLLGLGTSFNISGKSFSHVGINLSYSNCKGSICMIYLLLIHIASFLTWFIRCLCTFLVLTGSIMLISLIQLLYAIFTLLRWPPSACLFQASYVGCDVSPGFAGVICMRWLEVSVTFNCLKLFGILDVLLIWFSKNSWSLVATTKMMNCWVTYKPCILPLSFVVLKWNITHVHDCTNQNWVFNVILKTVLFTVEVAFYSSLGSCKLSSS